MCVCVCVCSNEATAYLHFVGECTNDRVEKLGHNRHRCRRVGGVCSSRDEATIAIVTTAAAAAAAAAAADDFLTVVVFVVFLVVVDVNLSISNLIVVLASPDRSIENGCVGSKHTHTNKKQPTFPLRPSCHRAIVPTVGPKQATPRTTTNSSCCCSGLQRKTIHPPSCQKTQKTTTARRQEPQQQQEQKQGGANNRGTVGFRQLI